MIKRLFTFKSSKPKGIELKRQLLESIGSHYYHIIRSSKDLNSLLSPGRRYDESTMRKIYASFGNICTSRGWMRQYWERIGELGFKSKGEGMNEDELKVYLGFYKEVYDICKQCGAIFFETLIALELVTKAEKGEYMGELSRECRSLMK